MVHALFLPLWPLVRLAMWLLISFTVTVFYKEAMVWLTGRFLRVAAWRQFFNLTAAVFGGEKWSLVACALPCIVSTVWDLIGSLYNSSFMETTLCRCFLRLGTLNGIRRSLRTPVWGATQSWELAQRSSLHLGSGCRDSSFGNPALAGPALPPFALPPLLGGFALAPCGRAGVCVCVCGCVGACGCVSVCVCVGACRAALLAGVSIPSCLHVLMKEPRKVFKLHTRRVFIMDDCDELIPRRFQYDTVF